MGKRFRIIKNMIKQGFEGMWRNRGMGVASVSSISAVLLILGVILILILSINNLVVEIQTKFDEVQIYIEDDISPENLKKIEDTIRRNESILSYTFESDMDALEKMKEDWEEDSYSYVLDGLEEDNPLPNSFILKVRSIEEVEDVIDEMESLEGVEKTPYHKDVIDRLLEIAKYIRIGGVAIIGVLILVSIFIISNTIKITVASREREIGIMKYVGATNGYIKGPFLVEGILFGLLAAIISIILINLGYDYFFNTVSDRIYYMMSVYLVKPAIVFKDIGIIFLAIGTGIGAVGSIVSLRKFLDV